MKTRLMIAGVIVAMLVGVMTLGAVSAQLNTPPSWVGQPPTPLSVDESQAVNLAGMYGTSKSVLANYRVTAHDLDALGISYPQWGGGEPANLRLVALGGAYEIPVLTKDEPAKTMPTDMTLMVIDAATGLPTVTISTSGAETQALLARVQAYRK